MTYELDIQFDRRIVRDSLLIEHAVGKPSVSSGLFVPLSIRDMQFHFEREVDAIAALDRLAGVPLLSTTIRLVIDD